MTGNVFDTSFNVQEWSKIGHTVHKRGKQIYKPLSMLNSVSKGAAYSNAECGKPRSALSNSKAGFFGTFAQKLKVKKTKTQAQKTQNSRIFCPKLKIPAIFSEI